MREPIMSTTVKIAGVQMDIRLGDSAGNLAQIIEAVEQAARQQAQLVVLPECALTGYCFDSLDEARGVAESIPGPSTGKMSDVCRRLGVYVVYGLLEQEEERIFNVAVLVGPDGVVGSYRKTHLPHLGIDRFTTPGDRPYSVHQAGSLRIGMNICYDSAFPEAARILSLHGADLIVLPTNWPPGAECMAECIVSARAIENHVYYMAINRIGSERGFSFIGHSKIAGPDGRILAAAPHTDRAMLFAEIDLQYARNKHIIRVPGKHEIDRFRDRRPDLYGPISERA